MMQALGRNTIVLGKFRTVLFWGPLMLGTKVKELFLTLVGCVLQLYICVVSIYLYFFSSSCQISENMLPGHWGGFELYWNQWAEHWWCYKWYTVFFSKYHFLLGKITMNGCILFLTR